MGPGTGRGDRENWQVARVRSIISFTDEQRPRDVRGLISACGKATCGFCGLTGAHAVNRIEESPKRTLVARARARVRLTQRDENVAHGSAQARAGGEGEGRGRNRSPVNYTRGGERQVERNANISRTPLMKTFSIPR